MNSNRFLTIFFANTLVGLAISVPSLYSMEKKFTENISQCRYIINPDNNTITQCEYIINPDNTTTLHNPPVVYPQTLFKDNEIHKYDVFSHYEGMDLKKLVSMIEKRFKKALSNPSETAQKFIDTTRQLEIGVPDPKELELCPYYPDKMLLHLLPSTGYSIPPFHDMYDKMDKARTFFNDKHGRVCLSSDLNAGDEINKIQLDRLDGIDEKCILSFNNALQIAPFLCYLLKKPIAWLFEKALSPCVKEKNAKLIGRHFEMVADMLVSATIVYALLGIAMGPWSAGLFANPYNLAIFVKNFMSIFLTVFRLINVKDLKSMNIKDALIQVLLLTGIYLFPMFTPQDLAESLTFKVPMCLSFTAQVHHHWVTKNIQLTYSKLKRFFGGLLSAVEEVMSCFVANPKDLNEQMKN